MGIRCSGNICICTDFITSLALVLFEATKAAASKISTDGKEESKPEEAGPKLYSDINNTTVYQILLTHTHVPPISSFFDLITLILFGDK
jgi:hypothetical protein